MPMLSLMPSAVMCRLLTSLLERPLPPPNPFTPWSLPPSLPFPASPFSADAVTDALCSDVQVLGQLVGKDAAPQQVGSCQLRLKGMHFETHLGQHLYTYVGVWATQPSVLCTLNTTLCSVRQQLQAEV